MHTIILTVIDVETVPENLSSGIGEKVLWYKYDQCIFLLSTTSEMFVGLFIRRQENLTEERHDHFSLPTSYFTEMKTLVPADDPLKETLLLLSRYYLIFPVYVTLVACEIIG
mmetsp:Transcript_36354/g.65454  ORF Transcript_36354/g.65454 Transcript_36354/m.65454 type:complete len:112 (+) Transcript_36354:1797-2132(+)